MSIQDKIRAFVEEGKKHTVPKTKKEKDLASHAAPYDKITHKDVLVGRGVVKEEEAEQVTEAKATYCGRCGTTHVPPSKGGTCPALKEEEIQEKTLTPAELKKREEIAKAMERENPGMPMGKKMAIATAQAKKVAEEAVEEGYEEDKKKAPFDTSRDTREVGKERRDQFGNRVKNIAKHLAKKGMASAMKKEEVEQIEENNLGLRSLVSTDPKKQPFYKTQKGRDAAAKKNVPALKSAIKDTLGRHPKPNLPEEVEQLDELNPQTYINYSKKRFGNSPEERENNQRGKDKKGNATIKASMHRVERLYNKQVPQPRYTIAGSPPVRKEEVEQIDEKFVIHKGKHEPGKVSSLGGQTLHGVTVKDVYTDKKEAQAHADAINKGRGYKPEDHKNPLYGGVLYQVSPMKEEVEHMEEAAKWRSSSAAKPDPDNDWDRSSKSTGGMRATSDTRGDTGGEYDHSSLENRKKAQVVAKTGKTTKASNTSLKNRIRASMAQKQNKPNLPEEVEQVEEGNDYTEMRRARKYGYDTGLEKEYRDLDAHDRAMEQRKKKEAGEKAKEGVKEAKDMTAALTKAIEKKTKGKETTYRDSSGVLKTKPAMKKEEVEQMDEAGDWESTATPTAIKIHHTSPKGKKGSTMVFSARDAQAHEKELKQAGHKVTHRQLMYGEKAGKMHPVNEERYTYSQFIEMIESHRTDK